MLETKKICTFAMQIFEIYALENWSLPTPQSGQTQSSGRDSNGVPGAMPCSSSPTAGSYSYPHTSQMYFAIRC